MFVENLCRWRHVAPSIASNVEWKRDEEDGKKDVDEEQITTKIQRVDEFEIPLSGFNEEEFKKYDEVNVPVIQESEKVEGKK